MPEEDANDGKGSTNHEPPEDFSFKVSLKVPPAVWRILMSTGAATPVAIWTLLHR